VKGRIGLRAVWAYHRILDRLTGGRFRTDRFYAPTLWLRTVGRTSGIVRENPVVYLADSERLVIVASNAGADEDPAWLRNLMAAPETFVRVGRERLAVRARLASPEETAGLWPRLLKINPAFDGYRARTTRPIPVVILEPRREEAP
jgi:deazaflavin-dependent oxidoreductase (nitroreductase family)